MDDIVKYVIGNSSIFSEIVKSIEEERKFSIVVSVSSNESVGTSYEVEINTNDIKLDLDDEANLANFKVIVRYWIFKEVTDESNDIVDERKREIRRMMNVAYKVLSDVMKRLLDNTEFARKYPLVKLIDESQRKQLLYTIHKVRIRKLKEMFADAVQTSNAVIAWSRIVRRKTKVPRIAPYQFMSLQHYKRYILLRHFIKRHRESIRYYLSQSYHVYAVTSGRVTGFFVIGIDDSGKYFCDFVEAEPADVYDFVRYHSQFFVDDKIVKREVFGYKEELVGNVLTVNPGGFRVQGDLKVEVEKFEDDYDVLLLRRNDIVEYLVKELSKKHPDIKRRVDTEMLYHIDRDFFANKISFVPNVMEYIEKKYKFEALQLLNRRVKLVLGNRYGNKHIIIIEKGIPIRGTNDNNPKVLILSQTTIIIKHKEHGVRKLIAPPNVILRFYINRHTDF